MDAAISHPLLVQILEACGLPLVVRRSGTGPVIVCLHATGHGARDFDRLARRLGGDFTFIALDWPGQGESPREYRYIKGTIKAFE